MPPVIDEDKCTACGVCVDVCPQDVFFGSDEQNTPIISYSDECWHEPGSGFVEDGHHRLGPVVRGRLPPAEDILGHVRPSV